MKIGVADYGMNVWDGGCFDLEERLHRLLKIGYDGIERLEATSVDEAVAKAATFRRLDAGFGTCRGPNHECSIRWNAALGREYMWVSVAGRDFDSFCRQASGQAKVCARWGIRCALHNHLGAPVESQEQVEEFLRRCPDCQLILDTGHLAGAGGDPVKIAREYAGRLAALHVKDFVLTDETLGLDRWTERLRFCELGGGEMGDVNAEVVRTVVAAGYDGWIFVEHDTHLRDSFEDLAVSREYLRKAGV
jgi:sugar phosphate isomerase/epimerase